MHAVGNIADDHRPNPDRCPVANMTRLFARAIGNDRMGRDVDIVADDHMAQYAGVETDIAERPDPHIMRDIGRQDMRTGPDRDIGPQPRIGRAKAARAIVDGGIDMMGPHAGRRCQHGIFAGEPRSGLPPVPGYGS